MTSHTVMLTVFDCCDCENLWTGFKQNHCTEKHLSVAKMAVYLLSHMTRILELPKTSLCIKQVVTFGMNNDTWWQRTQACTTGRDKTTNVTRTVKTVLLLRQKTVRDRSWEKQTNQTHWNFKDKRGEAVVKTIESSRDSEEGVKATSASGPQHLLDQVARNWVEEKAQHEQQQYQPQGFENQPAVVVPDEVAYGLQRAQKPHKTGIRATFGEKEEKEEGKECRWGKWGEKRWVACKWGKGGGEGGQGDSWRDGGRRSECVTMVFQQRRKQCWSWWNYAGTDSNLQSCGFHTLLFAPW